MSPPPRETLTTGNPEKRPMSPTPEELKKKPETAHRSTQRAPSVVKIGNVSVEMRATSWTT